MADPVPGQIAQARDRLLDLTLNNRMLHYRPPKRASIRVVDERVDQVWRLLVEEERKVEFLSREEHERFNRKEPPLPAGDEAGEKVAAGDRDGGVESGTDANGRAVGAGEEDVFDLPGLDEPSEGAARADEGGAVPERHADRFLQTLLAGESLQTSLLRLFQESTSAREELGVNVLFLAVGFLHWRPTDREDVVKAPIFLIPVELERTSAKRRFSLKPLGDDPILNPCLAKKLEVDFRLRMPEGPEDWAGFDVVGYLSRLAQAIVGRADWKVADEVYLGLFSFNKYLMYLDLDGEKWPAERGLLASPMLRVICGDRASLPTLETVVPAARDLDRLLDPESVFQVLDADSSQQAAIAAAKAGQSLVIQGPPGTGKSQSITNIISECLAAGKSVLFVSQKMAALEVVKSRLEGVGLGDFCLELHSTKAHRATMLAELERVMSAPPPELRSFSQEAQRLRQVRQQLNDYVKALHEPEGPAGITPYRAMGRVALLQQIPQVACEMPGWEKWDAAEIERLNDQVHALGRQMQNVWPVAEHPWRGVRLTLLPANVRHEATELLAELTSLLKSSLPAQEALAKALEAKPPQTRAAQDQLVSLGQFILDMPEAAAPLMVDDRWDATPAQVKAVLAKLKTLEEIKAALQGRYDLAAAAGTDWQPILERVQKHGGSIVRWLMPSHWGDRKRINRVTATGHRPGHKALLVELGQLAQLSRLTAEIGAAEAVGRHHFGEAWRGPESSSAELINLGNWLLRMRQLVRQGALPPAALALCSPAADRSELRGFTRRLGEIAAAWNAAWQRLRELLQIDERAFFSGHVMQTPLEEWLGRLDTMALRAETLLDWVQFQDVAQVVEKSPAGEFASQAMRAGIEPDVLSMAFEKQRLTLWIDRILAQREALRQFNAGRQEDLIGEFARLDSAWVQQSRDRLYGKLAQMRPASAFIAAKSSQVGILQGEFRRRRGGRSIRRILRDAGEVIQKVKPCVMMSPMSVAQYLDPVGLRFDVVVFDEASQVEPADALGAIARGSQLLLVGDAKQLPPTAFFSNLSGEAPGEASGDDAGEASLADMESILDRGEAVLPALPLRWHYRSRHESLIAFSNFEFYNNELVVFPSCHAERGEMGVSLRHDASDLYDRAKSRTNRGQARKVAMAVFDHYRRFPGKSLGVAAFSVAQQQAILDEVERLRRADESLEEFFAPARPEHFFVKNLETIQGDERDVIFMSVGHGRANPGERVGAAISNLNGDGGWRRLNVLITRARERYVIFTSILGQEMDLTGTSSRGVHAFKRYLDYAQSGQLPTLAAHDGEFGSPFEQAVHNALVDRGVLLTRQVGCAGYAIDLGVVDPDAPGRYILGIECDGATYHGSATARDRDRLRQQVLENLGWRIHRIWSTDWHRRPQAELERALDAIAKAKAGQLPPRFKGLSPDKKRTVVVPVAAPATERSNGQGQERPAIGVEPYRCFEASRARSSELFYTEPLGKLATLIAEIVRVEGPIHEWLLTRRAAWQYGLERVGDRVQERINAAIDRASKAEQLRARGEFYWPPGMTEPPLRQRQDESVRDVELVCLEEFGLAAVRLAKAQFGVSEADLIAQSAEVLGFRVATAKVKVRVGEAIAQEIAAGRLELDAQGVLRAKA